jgi:pimeloyl-ACP methyl ester carboxylesterase
MATIVLVHPGFAGGWVWRDVAADLRRIGHDVFTPTLTGLGERAHLASPNVDLDTHVQDVVGVLECEDLQGVVLVGSSSGVMAMTGAAERVPERLSRLIYVDTLVPNDGQSWMDLLTPTVATPLLEAARKYGDGWRVPRTDVSPPRWVPQPLRSVTQPLAMANPTAATLRRVYIHCTRKPAGWFYGLGPIIADAAKQAQAKGWVYREMDADHLPMLSAPHEFAVLLHEVTGEDR